jgi:two-component system chemotaxis response regulator CheB
MDRMLRVMVVDDSAYVRKVVKEMLSRSPAIEVVGVARDGREALELVEELQPDVITCDLIMPQLDGVGFVSEQMKRRPVPIIIMSIASETGDAALRALDAGAVDFIQKPTALATEKIFEIGEELISKVQTAARIPLVRMRTATAPLAQISESNGAPIQRRQLVDLVVLGISTGGPQALKRLIPLLPADFPVPLVMVMHMPLGYTEMYARTLAEKSQIIVREAAEGDELAAGTALLAPAGRHLSFRRREEDGVVVVHLDARPFEMLHRPSVDVLFQSAAEIYRDRVLGIVMTGMGSDGKQGAAWIKSQGGLIYTEAEETCVVYGMPLAVVEAGLSDRSVPLAGMARAIQEAV